MSSLYLQPELLNSPFFFIGTIDEHWCEHEYEGIDIATLHTRRFSTTETFFLLCLLKNIYIDHKVFYPYFHTLIQHLMYQRPDPYTYSFYYQYPGRCNFFFDLIQEGPYVQEWQHFLAIHARVLEGWKIEWLARKHPQHPFLDSLKQYIAYSYAPYYDAIPMKIPYNLIDPALATVIGKQSEGYYNVQALWNAMCQHTSTNDEIDLFLE